MPFPVPVLEWAGIEYLHGPADVAGSYLQIGAGYALEVQASFELSPRLLGLFQPRARQPLRIGGTDCLPDADGAAEQQGRRDEAGGDQGDFVPPRELAKAV